MKKLSEKEARFVSDYLDDLHSHYEPTYEAAPECFDAVLEVFRAKNEGQDGRFFPPTLVCCSGFGGTGKTTFVKTLAERWRREVGSAVEVLSRASQVRKQFKDLQKIDIQDRIAHDHRMAMELATDFEYTEPTLVLSDRFHVDVSSYSWAASTCHPRRMESGFYKYSPDLVFDFRDVHDRDNPRRSSFVDLHEYFEEYRRGKLGELPPGRVLPGKTIIKELT